MTYCAKTHCVTGALKERYRGKTIDMEPSAEQGSTAHTLDAEVFRNRYFFTNEDRKRDLDDT